MRFSLLIAGVAVAATTACRSGGARCPVLIPSNVRPDALAPVLVGAGDIADCDGCAGGTSVLLDRIPGTVFTAGDNAYEEGAPAEFDRCYAPTWGRHKWRTRPAPGNHEYQTRGARGYFDYFGAAAGTPGEGWYSYDVGSWHVVVLNSSDNCDPVACGPGSPQLAWLEADLAASGAECTVAIWHHPRYSSGRHGDHPNVAPFWDVLYANGAELVINGHDHNYERLAPITPAGLPDPAHGIRQIIVGTGGRDPLYEFPRGPLPITEVRDNEHFGVLRLDLRDAAYDWRFVPVEEGGFDDSGTGSCHGPPPSTRAPSPLPMPPA